MSNYFDNFYDWWKNVDKFVLLIFLGLFFLGLFFSLVSTSLIASDKLNTNSYYFFLKHLIFILSTENCICLNSPFPRALNPQCREKAASKTSFGRTKSFQWLNITIFVF